MSYVNTNKRSSNNIYHEYNRCRTGEYIAKDRSEVGIRNKNGWLDNIRVNRDMDNDRDHDGESRMSSSLSCCGGEGGERGEVHEWYKKKKGNSS